MMPSLEKQFHKSRAGKLLVLAVVLAAGASAGCGLSTFTSGLGGSVFGGSSNAGADPAKVNDDELLAAARGEGSFTGALGEVSTNCPRVVMPARDNNVTIYESGRAGDALAVMHRGELTKTARDCQIEGNRVTVKYGFSGRVLLGPKGRGGAIGLPVKIAVTDAKRESVKAENLKVETSVSLEKPIGYFSAVRTLSFELPLGTRPGEYEINVTFDRNIPGAG